MVINATSNFFIYMWKGRQFRRILQQKVFHLYHGRNRRNTETIRNTMNENTMDNAYEMNDQGRNPQTIRTELYEMNEV